MQPSLAESVAPVRKGNSMDRLTVASDVAPCVIHDYHSPVTVQNEFHHPFPQAWQMRLWGEIRDDRVVPVCGTGHNSIHVAITVVERTGKFPAWCVGKTRDMVEQAFTLAAEAERDAGL